MRLLPMKSTKNIAVPKKIVDQVIGQDEAVTIIKKAALQRADQNAASALADLVLEIKG